MRCFNPAAVLLRAVLFVFSFAPLHGQTAVSPLVPDWAQPGSATHKQVPPPADFHRPTTTGSTALGIFDGQSDVGSAVAPGSSAFDPGSGRYTIHSAGYNIWYTRDEFRFLWKKIEGDASLAVDGAFPNADGYGDSKIVLVIRQNLEDDSQEAMLGEHKTGMIHLAWRAEKGAMMKDMQYRFGGTLNGVQAKRIGIEKHGDAIAIFISLQGEPMHQLGPPLTMHLSQPFYIGVGFCSHLPATVDTGIVTNVSFSNAAGSFISMQSSTLQSRFAADVKAGKASSWPRPSNRQLALTGPRQCPRKKTSAAVFLAKHREPRDRQPQV